MNSKYDPPAQKLLYHENSGDGLWEGRPSPLQTPQNPNVLSVQQKYLQEQSLYNLGEPSGYG